MDPVPRVPHRPSLGIFPAVTTLVSKRHKPNEVAWVFGNSTLKVRRAVVVVLQVAEERELEVRHLVASDSASSAQGFDRPANVVPVNLGTAIRLRTDNDPV